MRDLSPGTRRPALGNLRHVARLGMYFVHLKTRATYFRNALVALYISVEEEELPKAR